MWVCIEIGRPDSHGCSGVDTYYLLCVCLVFPVVLRGSRPHCNTDWWLSGVNVGTYEWYGMFWYCTCCGIIALCYTLLISRPQYTWALLWSGERKQKAFRWQSKTPEPWCLIHFPKHRQTDQVGRGWPGFQSRWHWHPQHVFWMGFQPFLLGIVSSSLCNIFLSGVSFLFLFPFLVANPGTSRKRRLDPLAPRLARLVPTLRHCDRLRNCRSTGALASPQRPGHWKPSHTVCRLHSWVFQTSMSKKRAQNRHSTCTHPCAQTSNGTHRLLPLLLYVTYVCLIFNHPISYLQKSNLTTARPRSNMPLGSALFCTLAFVMPGDLGSEGLDHWCLDLLNWWLTMVLYIVFCCGEFKAARGCSLLTIPLTIRV